MKRPTLVEETLPLPPGTRVEAPLRVVVRVLDAEAEPRSFRLSASKTCRIGTSPEADVVVTDRTVSRTHAELTLGPDGILVTDVGSRNGIFFLGQRIERAVLGHGARIQLGAVTVALDVDEDALHAGLEYTADAYRGVLGSSASMRRLFALLVRLERSLMPILVSGESGVGKEVIAQALHEGSRVSDGPLVTLNCGALPRELVASELFGHRRGAFTGASEARKGAFDMADGGTLFLDEIGELPLDVQPVLLRAVESGEVRAVGEDSTHRVKVRLVAATNRDLEAEITAGRFREDLFYRLAVVRLEVPPLRERVEDVPALAAKFGRDAGVEALEPAVIDELRSRPLPGNVRELRNLVHAYAALGVLPRATRSRGAMLDTALRELIDPRAPYAAQKDALLDRFQELYLDMVMGSVGQNQTAAARVAGLDRGYVGKLLRKKRP